MVVSEEDKINNHSLGLKKVDLQEIISVIISSTCLNKMKYDVMS